MCSSATAAGPLHLRRRIRRRGSLLLATVAASAVALDRSGCSVDAYSFAAVPPTAAAPTKTVTASDLLATARILREQRRRRASFSSSDDDDDDAAVVNLLDLDRLHSHIFGASPPSASAWTESLFGEPEAVALSVDSVETAIAAAHQRQMEGRIQDELADLSTLRAASVEDDVSARLQEEAAARRRTTEKMAPAQPAFVATKKTSASAVNKEKKTSATAALSSSSSRSRAVRASSTATATTKTTKPTKFSKKKRQQQTTTLSPLTERHERLTAEEEIELARIIRQGTELHRLKTAFEAEHGRDITRQEWTDLAMQGSTADIDMPIANPRDLRRLISAYRSAKNRLVSSNMGLVYAVVRSKHGHRLRMAGISEDELVQEGSLGLLRAAELFDPDRYGARFSTYATTWIKGMLSNSRVDQAISVPARETTKWNKIRRAAADIAMENCGGEQQETNKQPKAKEVASRTGLNLDEVQHTTSKMAQVQKVLSLDYRYRTVRRSEVEDHAGFDHDRAVQVDADLAERITFRSDVVAALVRNLSEEEGRLLRLRYGLDADADGSGGRSLAECAAIMGWSRDKARLLANKCLQKLREADGAEALQEYLLTVA